MRKVIFSKLILFVPLLLLASGCRIALGAPVAEPPAAPVKDAAHKLNTEKMPESVTETKPDTDSSQIIEPQNNSTDYYAALSVSDENARYLIYIDKNGADPPYMYLERWLKAESETAVLPNISDEINATKILDFDSGTPVESNTVPDEALGAVLKGIDSEAFSECTQLFSVSIPETVEYIGDSAFSDTALNSIILPNSVNSLGTRIFSNCQSLTSVKLAEGISVIPESCFSGCTALIHIELPDSVSEISADAFSGCSALQNIVLGDNLKYIAYRAFYGCSSLESVSFPSQLVYIGTEAFEGAAITDINLPAGLQELGSYAFKGTSLSGELPMLPASLSHVGANPFYGTPAMDDALDKSEQIILTGSCSFLIAYSGSSNVRICDGVQVICADCFRDSDITSVVIPESVVEIGESAFRNCRKLESVTMHGVRDIDNCAFLMCTALRSCILSDDLESIGYDTFWNCTNLKTIVLPKSLSYIDDYAFDNCFNLSVQCPAGSYAYNRCTELNIPVISQ